MVKRKKNSVEEMRHFLDVHKITDIEISQKRDISYEYGMQEPLLGGVRTSVLLKYQGQDKGLTTYADFDGDINQRMHVITRQIIHPEIGACLWCTHPTALAKI